MRFEIFKKFDGAGGRDGDEFFRWNVTVTNIIGLSWIFFSLYGR